MPYPDLVSVVNEALRSEKRPPTGLLHCSSHAWAPLRFSQLKAVLEVPDEDDYGSLITMHTGTLYHHWLEDVIKSRFLLSDEWMLEGTEIDLTDDLPFQWTGTCDFLFKNLNTGKYVVGDLKTINADSVAYLNGEPKKEHIAQVRAYHAALSQRYDLDPEIFVLYLPKSKTKQFQTVEPLILTAQALHPSLVFQHLKFISSEIYAYKCEYERTGEIINDYLCPMPIPELKIYWDAKQGNWNVSSRASWYEDYLTKGLPEWTVPRTPTMKVGHYTLDLNYVPRKGIPQPDNIPIPSQSEINRRRY